MSVMKGQDGTPHTFPACVIGGFGVRDRGRRSGNLRSAKVAVRLTNKPGEIQNNQRAERILAARNEYRFEDPPPGVDPNVIDSFWNYEDQLVQAIQALESGSFTCDDWRTALEHVHAQSVRSRDFPVRAAAYLIEQGIPEPTRDQIQVERIKTLANTPTLLARCRFALVHRPADGRRFIVNDKGYAKPMLDVVLDVKNVVFPLSPEVAVLMVVDAARSGDDYKVGPMRELTMTPAMVDLVNEASWELGGIMCVLGHPDDASYMLRLGADRPFAMPWLGPFRGTGDVGLSDWAVLDEVARRLTVINVGTASAGAALGPDRA